MAQLNGFSIESDQCQLIRRMLHVGLRAYAEIELVRELDQSGLVPAGEKNLPRTVDPGPDAVCNFADALQFMDILEHYVLAAEARPSIGF